MPATKLALVALLAGLVQSAAAAADDLPLEEEVCDASDPSCAEGLALRQLRASHRHSQVEVEATEAAESVEALQAHVSLEGASLGDDDLLIAPGKAVLVQGTGLLLGPRAEILSLAKAAGADTGAEEPFPLDCEKVAALPQLTFAIGEGETLVLQGAQYTSRRADGQCVLTALTLDDHGPSGADWVLGDFEQLSSAGLARERWFGFSSSSMGKSLLSGSKCSLCQNAVQALGTESVDTMCTSTCHSYGVPFGCSKICRKLEKHICGTSGSDPDSAANCNDALCSYFMPSCSGDGSSGDGDGDGSSGGSSGGYLSSVFGSGTKCNMCLSAFKTEGGQSVDQACQSTCEEKGIPFGCTSICRKLEQKVCGTTGDGSGNPECGKALCGYFITGCGGQESS